MLAHGLRGSKILVAVSGGPDSLTLVHVLAALRGSLELRLSAAHLDHGLRGEASSSDTAFVRQAMEELEVPLVVDSVNVRAFREQQRLSVEAAARHLRYDFLARVGRRVSADVVAVGHTLDDQAETVLLHILRGTGLAGLSAMSVTNEMRFEGRRLTVYRPLLNVTKSQTSAYCAENALLPRFDESNLSRDYTRNRIRLDLLPHLASYNPEISAALGRLAESASYDLDFISRAVSQAVDSVVVHEDQGVALKRREFARLHPSVQRHLLRRVIGTVSESAWDIEFVHMEQMMLLMSGPAGKRTNLPGQLTLEVDYDLARITSTGDRHAAMQPDISVQSAFLTVPGEAKLGRWTVVAEVVENRGATPGSIDRDGRVLTERFDANILCQEMVLRTRLPDDVFWPLGMSGHKKLSVFMKDTHIPRRCRETLPLVTTPEGGIAWVVGWRIAEWAKITEATRTVIEIRCTYETP